MNATTATEWDGSNVVPIEFVEWITEQRRLINRLAIEDVTFTRNGEPVDIDSETLEEFKCSGLNTVDGVMFFFAETDPSS